MICLKITARYYAEAAQLDYLLEVGYFYGTLTEARARKVCGVHRTTWLRWREGTSRIPHAALELLRLHAFGEPPGHSNEWSGFRFQNGVLVTPYCDNITPDVLKALWVYRQSESYGLACIAAARMTQQEKETHV